MHCCMWSNMKKKKVDFNSVPQSLLNDLERKDQPKAKDSSTAAKESSSKDFYEPPHIPG